MPAELIAVLDVDSIPEAQRVVEQCGACRWFKVGLQLFTREGPPAIEAVQAAGKQVMLDLKYHDIPNTVGNAARAAADLGVGMFTLHAIGGKDMIAAARKAVEGTETKILAVTILTSLSADKLQREVGLPETPEAAVLRLGRQAIAAGAHGLVCSPQEARVLRAAIGPRPLLVTPGVRPEWATKDDQARVATPREAAHDGATHIVVGRPILAHASPAEAVRLINEELGVV